MNAVTVLAAGSGVAFVVYGVLCLGSPSMEAEFVRFGLSRFRVLTGVLEVLAGVGLLVGLRWSPALWLSAGVTALTHGKDPVIATAVVPKAHAEAEEAAPEAAAAAPAAAPAAEKKDEKKEDKKDDKKK